MRAIAIIAAYNEERFIGRCLEHHIEQGLEVYLIDNGSTDATASIAEAYLGEGLLAIEPFERHGVYSWRPLLERKEELSATLDADWYLHVDADEFREPPRDMRHVRLIDALGRADASGYNAVDFLEFVFVPTREDPDHDRSTFQETMRWYYPFRPSSRHRVTAWKRQAQRVDLAGSGGHVVSFPGRRISPVSLAMRHYMFLSPEHALEKYVARIYDATELADGWHRKRAALRADQIRLPCRSELRELGPHGELDGRGPRSEHFLFDEAWRRSRT